MIISDAANAREHYRIPAKIRVFFCQDSAEARSLMVSDYAIWASQPVEFPESAKQPLTDIGNVQQELKPLYAMMQWLNFKMDTVLYQLRVVSRSKVFTEHLLTSDLSVAGFAFGQKLNLALGSRLLLALHLPDEPVHPVYTVGVLVRDGMGCNDSPTPGAIVFEEISDADRERIARFAFSFERKLKNKQI